MKLIISLIISIFSLSSFASQCNVGCTYISKYGILAGACSQNKVQALAQAQINCLGDLKNLFGKHYIDIAPQAMSMCEIPKGNKIKLNDIRCDYYKNRYYFEDEFLKQSCSMPSEVNVLGVTIFRKKSNCE